METSLPLHILPYTLSGYPPSTRSRFGVVAVVVLPLGTAPSGQPLVHSSGVGWLGRLGPGLFGRRFFFLAHTRRRLRPVGTASG